MSNHPQQQKQAHDDADRAHGDSLAGIITIKNLLRIIGLLIAGLVAITGYFAREALSDIHSTHDAVIQHGVILEGVTNRMEHIETKLDNCATMDNVRTFIATTTVRQHGTNFVLVTDPKTVDQ